MLQKFNKGNVRLWVGKDKNSVNIGIHIRKVVPKLDFTFIYEAIAALLTLKYGKSDEA